MPNYKPVLTKTAQKRLRETLEEIRHYYFAFEFEAKDAVDNHNKAAARRSRRISLKLRNLLKEWKAKTLEYGLDSSSNLQRKIERKRRDAN